MSVLDHLTMPAALKSAYSSQAVHGNFRLTLPKPWASWQTHLITAKIKLQYYPCGVKTGKTYGASMRLIQGSFAAPVGRDAILRLIAPTYALTELTFRYVNRMVPEHLPNQPHMTPQQYEIAKATWEAHTMERSESRRWFRWRHNNARIYCLHGQDPQTTIEGEGTYDNVIDEASKCHQDVFASVQSTTAATGGSIALVGSPIGKGWTWKLKCEIEEHMAWCERHNKPYEMFTQTVPSTISPWVKKEHLERARRLLPARLFAQHYLAEFQDDGNVFRNLAAAFGNAVDFLYQEDFMLEAHDSAKIFFGADWAKTNDYSVFIAINEQGKMLGWKRMQNVSYTAQVEVLFEWMKTIKRKSRLLNPSLWLRHDKTGVGAAVDDIIRDKDTSWFSLSDVVWDNTKKSTAVNDLILSFEETALDLLPWGTLQSELNAFEVSSTSTGLPKYAAPTGQHDDAVLALVTVNQLFRDHRGDSGGVVETFDPLELRIAHYHMTGQEDELEDL